MGKVINKSSEIMHQLKIKGNRLKYEIEKEGERKPRPNDTCPMSGNEQSWYFTDGKVYNSNAEEEQSKVGQMKRNDVDKVSQTMSYYMSIIFFKICNRQYN